jgi:hypothetical protein
MQPEFWPQDTDTEIYIAGECDLESILDRIKQKWPETSLANISLETEYIQTHCLGYDLYDSGDYTKFIVIKWKG